MNFLIKAMPKISFIMPTRDREKIIHDSIESVLKQTEKDIELVIVDDHSQENDNTIKIIENFKDSRIRYFKLTDENGIGISAARNFGVMLAKSEIVAFIDSDDICLPERATLTIEAIKNGSDLVYSNIVIWNPETGECTSRSEKFQPNDFDLERFKQVDYIPTSTVATKRDIAIKFCFNTFFRRAEDHDFLLRIARSGYKMHYIDEVLIKYREHQQAITKEKNLLFDYGMIVREKYQINNEETSGR